MTPTYDTHCPVCREAITVTLGGDDETTSGYFVATWTACACNPLDEDWMEAWDEFCNALEDHSPGWWAETLERQQMRRNVESGLQPALPL